jgi:hypothetical protein
MRPDIEAWLDGWLAAQGITEHPQSPMLLRFEPDEAAALSAVLAMVSQGLPPDPALGRELARVFTERPAVEDRTPRLLRLLLWITFGNLAVTTAGATAAISAL